MSVAKLYKQFSKLSDEERAELMDLLNDNEEVEQKVNEQVVETKPQQKEEKMENVETQPKEEEKKDGEVVNKTDETIVEEQPQVKEQVNDDFTGIDISQVALKDDVNAKLDAMNAKLEAIIKENQDLKDKLSNAEKENQDLHSKYEKGDFGNNAERNFGEKDFGQSYESADDYLKKFM